MAITATDRGTGTESAANTSVNVAASLSGTLSSGNVGVLCLMMDNAGGASTNVGAIGSTINDSAGNVWYLRISRTDGSANANLEGAVYTSYLTSNLTSAGTLTISFNNTTTAKAWTFIEVSTNLSNSRVFFASNMGAFTAVQSATASPTQTLTDTVLVGNVIIGVGGAEAADTWTAGGDADTSNGTWSSPQHAGVGSGNTGMSIITQTKVVTGYGTQTYNPAISTGTPDCRIGGIILLEADNKFRGSTQNGNAEATTTIPLTVAMAAGSLAVVCLAADNVGGTGSTAAQPSSLTDSQSNTWTQRATGFCDPAAASAGVEISIYTSVLTTGLGVTDTITCTWISQAASKAAIVLEFAPSGAGVMTYVSGSMGNNSGGTPTTAPQVTTSSITSGDWVIAMTGAEAEDNLTGDSDTTNGTWRPQSATGRGQTATAMFVGAQAKQVTATATQSYDATFGATTDWATAWVSIHDSTPTGGLTASQKAAFFQMF